MNRDLPGGPAQPSDDQERLPYMVMVGAIKANAEAAIEELRPVAGMDFGYNRQSIQWLEGYIERMKEAGAMDIGRDKLISVFGSFLGECVIACYGGAWRKRAGAWGVAFDHENIAYPYGRVARQIDHGPVCGIRSFFDLIPIEFIGCIESKAQPRKQRWQS